jgi:hypothetical protein
LRAAVRRDICAINGSYSDTGFKFLYTEPPKRTEKIEKAGFPLLSIRVIEKNVTVFRLFFGDFPILFIQPVEIQYMK